MLRYLPLILKNCWRNRRRTVLTVISIAVSMCLLGVMISMYHAFYLSSPVAEEAQRLVVRNRISLTVEIPEFYGPRIRQIPGVRGVMISQWFGGTYKDARSQELLRAPGRGARKALCHVPRVPHSRGPEASIHP
jgi:putative ABC transport system permease protein